MTEARGASASWFEVCPSPAPAALRLFCFPYAGGAGYGLRAWRNSIPRNVELVNVVLPGRGPRFAEPPYKRMEPLIGGLLSAMHRYLDVPFALFGHSMGGFIAYELCRRLESTGRAVNHLIVSGTRAPHLQRSLDRLSALPKAELLARLAHINGTSPEVLQDESAMSLYLPTLRADFELVETYQRHDRPALSCGITALAGADDPTVPPEEVRAWSSHTLGGFSYYVLSGDHFFIFSEVQTALRIVSDALMKAPSHSAFPARSGSASS